jgi:hypothetical protein
MPPPLSPDALRDALRVAFSAARAVAARHRNKLLRFPNVIDVGTGYKFTGGWITSTPALVVTVLRKDPPEALDAASMLPAELDGVPVDVAAATPAEQLRHLAGTRSVTAAPPPEPFLQPGGVSGDDEGLRAAGGGRGYKEPADLKLSAVRGAMTLTCHCSPDAGWPTLKKFLAATEKSLTVAMYDFGAKYIFEAIKDAMTEADGPFLLNLDRKSNPSRDGEYTEAEIEESFRDALGDRFKYSTAAVGTLYPTAYHIKVAVRDSRSVWLSSGNWQQSNQPEEDTARLPEAEQRRLLGRRNREWHVIADSPKLAKTFEAYIKYDAAGAAPRAGGRGPVPPRPDLVLPDPDVDTRAATVVKVFAPKKFTFTAADPVKVQPILTPDNYGTHILDLIRSATETLYFQNQYIKIYQTFPDTAGKPGLKELIDALIDRIAAGVDVRIILRNTDARPMLQALQTYGLDTSCVKLLGGCHNKGIIVDSRAVLVSSQNYSADGVRFNRDAGMIIHHPKVAAYYEKVFLYDWEHRANQSIPGERGAMPLLREVADAAPRGTRAARGPAQVVAWDDYYQD